MTDLTKIEEQKLKRKSSTGGSPKLLNLPRNWLHQALFYMDRTEFLVRVFVEGICLFCLLFPLSFFFQSVITDWRVLVVSFLLVHTLNWILNGNWWALMMFTFPGIHNSGEELTCKYLSDMADRLKTNRSIAALAVYGSPARGQWHDKSDLDLRILRKKGFLNGWAAALVTMRERCKAFVAGQPVDLFLSDSPQFLMKMREDENPIILLKRGDEAENAFMGTEETLGISWPKR
jgi:predicted nucleotidyltransferase